jgi:hypothetical protein
MVTATLDETYKENILKQADSLASKLSEIGAI